LLRKVPDPELIDRYKAGLGAAEKGHQTDTHHDYDYLKIQAGNAQADRRCRCGENVKSRCA
jgi:hypothetical protein